MIAGSFALRRTGWSLLVLVLLCPPADCQELPFYAGGTYDASVPTPDSVLGFSVGKRPLRYDEVVRYLNVLARHSPRVRLFDMGRTCEGRTISYVVLAAQENIGRLDEIKKNNAVLADPRRSGGDSRSALIAAAPGIVWAEYAIHGDELSSVDAALQLCYQLAAGTDEGTLRILRELVVCIDPIVNPDGRERYLAQMQQWNTVVPNPDAQSIHHTGVWPYGRGNHYLFDLNRDWFILAQPEMKSRVETIVQWNPHLMIDSHEMGSYDTYLFSPPRPPINPNLNASASKWWKVFAADQAKAFDRYGWNYYTREWNDEWYPGYGASWALYTGAMGILYEQAQTDGSVVKRPDGTALTFREAVHHHFVSTMANLTTAAERRNELLTDFAAERKDGIREEKYAPEAFYCLPGTNPSRLFHMVERLAALGVEVTIAEKEFSATDLIDVAGAKAGSRRLPSGTAVISLAQPMGRLAKAILEFDPRMTSSFLQEERKSLEKEKDSKLYDVTAWSLPLAYGLEAYTSTEKPPIDLHPLQVIPRPKGRLENSQAGYGFLMEYADDRAVEALAMLLQRGVNVRVAKEPFAVEGKSYARGTILFRRNENLPTLPELLKTAAESSGVLIRGTGTALSTSGPDLGGNDMVLLQEPRIVLVTGPEVGTTSFGSIWHLLDYRLSMRTTLLSAQSLGFTDLRKYNVIVLPSSGDAMAYQRALGKTGITRIKEWTESGGTLIGIGNAAAFLADTSTGFSSVRLKNQAFRELDLYARSVETEKRGMAPSLDSVALWSGRQGIQDTAKKDGIPNEKEIALQDDRGRLFMPRGAILKVDLDPEHWMNFGAGEMAAAIIYSPNAFLSRDPVRTPGRFADAEHLRLSGLLWPEARARLAKTAYATRESRGRGQIILFAGDPNFRGSFQGTERLLLNALFFGPGFGSSKPVEW
jgi:hypothetical protein